MAKWKFMTVSSLALVFLLGCASDQPSFNPNNKGLVIVAGKPYRVPLEANHSLVPFKSENAQGVVKGRQAGLDCRKGDIFWISTEVQKAAQEASLDGDVNRAASIIIAAPRKRQIGCAHPLSNKEYEYYREKQQK
jgi:hypothetical protein